MSSPQSNTALPGPDPSASQQPASPVSLPIAQSPTGATSNHDDTIPAPQSQSAPLAPPSAGQAQNPPKPIVSKTPTSRSSPSTWEKLRSYASPSTHDVFYDPTADDTMQTYSYKKQRRALWSLCISEWLITLVLSVMTWGSLFGFSHNVVLDVYYVRIFNSLMTGLSIGLGLNLASSLTSYAKLMRWRLLATEYRSLEIFELIMGCDQLWNVVKLLFKTPRKKLRFIPSKTQLICLLWLLVNLAATVLVAMLGLTYNVDQSSFVLFENGTLSVLNLNAFPTGDTGPEYLAGLLRAQENGIAGLSYRTCSGFEYIDHCGPRSFNTDFNGHSRYWFGDWDASKNFNSEFSEASYRYVDFMASCASYQVVEGQHGNLSYVVYVDNNGNRVTENINGQGGPGGMTFIPDTTSDCGDRCVNIKAFQAISDPGEGDYDVQSSHFYLCTNTASQVSWFDGQPANQNLSLSTGLPNVQAQILAGAIGWTGRAIPNDTQQYQYYQIYSGPLQFTDFNTAIDSSDLAKWISWASAGAVAAMDASLLPGTRNDVPGVPVPYPSSYLKVHWWRAGALVIVIPAIHFLTMMAVIIWANKAIIRHDSPISNAKVYQSLLASSSLAGKKGCMLRGDEIIAHIGNPIVAYGWENTGTMVSSRLRKGEMEELKHVDIFEKDASTMRIERAFEPGIYDGTGLGSSRRKEKLD